MLFVKLFKWDENVVISDTSAKPQPSIFKPVKTDFISDILKEDPMFLSG